MFLTITVVMFCLGLFFIIKGGDILVKAALELNKCTGINTVIIGATFVSVATTLPEVFVSIFAVMANNHGIAVGNAIGAMITNVALVLAASLVFLPNGIRRGEIFVKSIYLFTVTAVVFLFAFNLWVSWWEGVILLTAFVAFLAFNVREINPKKMQNVCENCPEMCAKNTLLPPSNVCFAPQKCTFDASKTCILPPKSTKFWVKILLGFVIGQVMLCVGAFALVENGEELAHIFNISETVIGFTVIAIGTSLPELVTAITSIRRKSGGLAIGNVIGANIINCTLLLGVCGIIGDIKGHSLPVSRETVFVALPVLFIMTMVAVLPVLIRGRAYRAQGVALFILYAIYITYLMIVQPL
jgi:cation:H+ antiporter